mmetsp:Transcript_17081/g.23680  ORF Transcript_17081/g.23680 Transcript_17081/m.23680 type:complete len:228 (+) Transcript_17081:61-744(+)
MDDTVPNLSYSRAAKVRGNLPQEFELAQLIKDIENPLPSWNTSTPACKWKGVVCTDGIHISKIRWSRRTTLPPHLRTRSLCGNGFSGRLHLQHLPQSLETLDVSVNRAHGSVDLTRLPHGLTLLYLNKNMLSGNVVFDCLPQTMKYLNLGNNQFTGCLDFRHLPLTLTSLSCNDNNFDTLVPVQNLPPELRYLHLQNNPELKGVLEKSTFPVILTSVDVTGTRLTLR